MVLVVYKPMNSIVLVGLIVTAIHFLQAGRKRATLPGAEESMTTTIEFITALFYEVDEQMGASPKHPEAHLCQCSHTSPNSSTPNTVKPISICSGGKSAHSNVPGAKAR